MELLAILLEALGCFAETFDVVLLAFDLFAWIKGKDNRRKRRDAKKSGEHPPKRDFWSRLFIVLGILTICLTALLIWKWTK
ncbi:MAG: hypothetical protein H8E44_22135 [Planctomycetes bacterium]|nr:hypothetical protein [Planctomycetota bacterium]